MLYVRNSNEGNGYQLVVADDNGQIACYDLDMKSFLHLFKSMCKLFYTAD
jgi:hypothetical protein